MITENGRFHINNDGICLSISDFHTETWSPVWKINQVVMGLVSYWIGNEYTYGAIGENEISCKPGLSAFETKV